MSAGFFMDEEPRDLLRLLYVLLIALLPFAAFGFIALRLPELADGVGELGCHGVISIAATHQILSQPALILFHCPISLSKVPLLLLVWQNSLSTVARPDSTRSLFFCAPLFVVITGLGSDLAG
jgi:hypothetical protein